MDVHGIGGLHLDLMRRHTGYKCSHIGSQTNCHMRRVDHMRSSLDVRSWRKRIGHSHGLLWGTRMGIGDHMLGREGVHGETGFLTHDWWRRSCVVKDRVGGWRGRRVSRGRPGDVEGRRRSGGSRCWRRLGRKGGSLERHSGSYWGEGKHRL